MLNIGSQLGFEVLLMARIVGPNGKVIVLEPYSESYQMMRKSVYINSYEDRIITFNMGASNKREIGTLNVNYKNTGAAQVNDRKEYIEA